MYLYIPLQSLRSARGTTRSSPLTPTVGWRSAKRDPAGGWWISWHHTAPLLCLRCCQCLYEGVSLSPFLYPSIPLPMTWLIPYSLLCALYCVFCVLCEVLSNMRSNRMAHSGLYDSHSMPAHYRNFSLPPHVDHKAPTTLPEKRNDRSCRRQDNNREAHYQQYQSRHLNCDSTIFTLSILYPFLCPASTLFYLFSLNCSFSVAFLSLYWI